MNSSKPSLACSK